MSNPSRASDEISQDPITAGVWRRDACSDCAIAPHHQVLGSGLRTIHLIRQLLPWWTCGRATRIGAPSVGHTARFVLDHAPCPFCWRAGTGPR